MEKILPILVAIFIAVLCLIFLTRLVLSFLIRRAHNRYLAIKDSVKKSSNFDKKNYTKEEEELLRVKLKIPKAHSKVKSELMAKKSNGQDGSYELISSEQEELDRRELNRVEIVDIVKPVGFWTAKILGDKLASLIHSARILSERGDKGFWASMIEAQEREAGRQRGRGR